MLWQHRRPAANNERATVLVPVSRVRNPILTAALLAFALMSHGFVAASPASSGRVGVRHYGLDLSFAAGSNTIEGVVTIALTLPHPIPGGITLDMAPTLSARAVSIDGKPARFAPRGAKLIVEPPPGLAGGSVHDLRISYAGTPNTHHLRFEIGRAHV